ncbi:MAG TPA: hypothetical protein PLE68_09650 [Bacillota bacterium]|nr:hypothetical protein [Bacillota bacterium]
MLFSWPVAAEGFPVAAGCFTGGVGEELMLLLRMTAIKMADVNSELTTATRIKDHK